MITYKQRDDGLIEFDPGAYKGLISCEIRYRADCGEWKPAAIYRSVDTDYMLDEADLRYWNYGITKGSARFRSDEDDYRVYWNKHVNLGDYKGKAELDFSILSVDGVFNESLVIESFWDNAVYLDKWSEYTGINGTADVEQSSEKWYISRDRYGSEILSVKSKDELPEIVFKPGVEGLYEVCVCLQRDTAKFHISTSESPCRYKFMPGGEIFGLYEHDFCDKEYKEIKWMTVNFKKDTQIKISQIVNSNYVNDFGNISYIKLVPRDCTVAVESPEISENNVTLYFEPYSCAACYGMVTQEGAAGTVNEFLRLEPDELTCQVGRIGAKAVYYSNIIDRVDMACPGDDMVEYSGQVVMVKNMDVLAVISEYCREKGIFLTANLGVNRPYIGEPVLTDRFVFNNMDKVKGGLLDYTFPEVMDYATGIVDEIVSNYDISGFMLDFMRTGDNQTRDTLVELIRRVRTILDTKKKNDTQRLKLTVRIPSESAVYYEAAAVWVEEKLVDVIVPSYETEMVPLPRIEHYVRLCNSSETKVYGCIDGWKKFTLLEQSFGNVENALSPKDVKNAVRQYRDWGASGIFIYQGENYVFNPLFTPDLFKESSQFI